MRKDRSFNLKFDDGSVGRLELLALPEGVVTAIAGLIGHLRTNGVVQSFSEGAGGSFTEGDGETLVPASPADFAPLLEALGKAVSGRRSPRGAELVTAYIETMEITHHPCDLEAAEKLGTAAGRFAAMALAELERKGTAPIR